MKLKFPRQTKYAPTMAEWVRTRRTQIDAGHDVVLELCERTGFVRKTALIMIGKDAEVFETDWKWSPHTFPSPLKALAQALQLDGMVGGFATQFHAGRITIRRVEPSLAGCASQSRQPRRPTLRALSPQRNSSEPTLPARLRACLKVRLFLSFT